MLFKRGGAAAVLVAATLSSGCGEFARQSQSPSQLVIIEFLTAEGPPVVVPGSLLVPPSSAPTFIAGQVYSDIPGPGDSYSSDLGRVRLSVILRDPGAPGATTAPTPINEVTITRYRVVYRRADGLNAPGIHVPFAFDGAVTFTVPGGGSAVGEFELVRHNAKLEPPLAALGVNQEVLTTIAEVTFYGRDQAGNEVAVTGNIQVNFGSFI